MAESTRQITLTDVRVISIETRRGRDVKTRVQELDAYVKAEASLESWDMRILEMIYNFSVAFKPEGLFSLKLGVQAFYRCSGYDQVTEEELISEAVKRFYPVYATAALSIAQISQSMGFPPLVIPYGDEKVTVSGPTNESEVAAEPSAT